MAEKAEGDTVRLNGGMPGVGMWVFGWVDRLSKISDMTATLCPKTTGTSARRLTDPQTWDAFVGRHVE